MRKAFLISASGIILMALMAGVVPAMERDVVYLDVVGYKWGDLTSLEVMQILKIFRIKEQKKPEIWINIPSIPNDGEGKWVFVPDPSKIDGFLKKAGEYVHGYIMGQKEHPGKPLKIGEDFTKNQNGQKMGYEIYLIPDGISGLEVMISDPVEDIKIIMDPVQIEPFREAFGSL